MEHALPCVKCDKPLRNISDAGDNQPIVGTEFTAYGHYGSTIHDEAVREDLDKAPMLLEAGWPERMLDDEDKP